MLHAEVLMPWSGRHHLGVLRGLYELAAEGRLTVGYATEWPGPLIEHDNTMMVRYSREGGRPVSVAYDVADWPEILSPQVVALSDVYLKRSYLSSQVSGLPPELAERIHPYGLSLPADVEKDRRSLAFYWNRLVMAGAYVPPKPKGPRAYALMKNVVARSIRRRHSGYALDPAQFPRPNWDALAADPRVYYQTRVWDPEENHSQHHRSIEELNALRVSLVRLLRRELGPRFVGGLIPTDYARQQYPDLLTILGSDFRSYLENMGSCLIAVTEAGIHGSNGARLPELLGSGRCVVSEPLFYAPLVAPSEGTEIHCYRSPDECLELCSRMLDNPEEAVRIAKAGLGFYRREVAPAALAGRVLALAGLAERLDLGPLAG